MLDKNDEKVIEKIVEKVSVKVVGEALEEIVLPQIQELRNDFEDHKKENQKQFKGISKKIEGVSEDVDSGFTDVNNSLNRIETLVRSEVKYVDDLSARVIKLEKKPA